MRKTFSSMSMEDLLEMEAPYWVTREALDKVTQPIISSAQGIAKTTRMQVHYLEGKNIVEFFVHVDENKTVEEMACQIFAAKCSLRNDN